MEYKEAYDKIKREFERTIASDKATARFYAKLRDGTASYADATAFANRSGRILAETCGEQLEMFFGEGGIPPDAIAQLMPPVLREECETVLKNSSQVQKSINKKAGLQLNPVDVPVNDGRISGLVTHMEETGIQKESGELIANLAMSHVDDTILSNAEFQSRSGLRVTVSRYYDDVGVNHRTEDCQWCLDRTGVDVPYREAKSRGMFERHPGCNCTLEYHTEKRTDRQTNWTRNEWRDSREIIEQRKKIGIED